MNKLTHCGLIAKSDLWRLNSAGNLPNSLFNNHTFSPQVPLEDLQQASSYLVQALELRKRYMEMSQQSYATITARFVRSTDANAPAYVPSVHVQKHIAGMTSRFLIYLGWKVIYTRHLGLTSI